MGSDTHIDYKGGEIPDRSGEVAVLIGMPLALCVLATILMLNLFADRAGGSAVLGGAVGSLVILALFLLPYSLVAGALEAFYGFRDRIVVCAALAGLAAAVGFVAAALVSDATGVLEIEGSAWAGVVLGAGAQLAAAVAAVVFVRHTHGVETLRERVLGR